MALGSKAKVQWRVLAPAITLFFGCSGASADRPAARTLKTPLVADEGKLPPPGRGVLWGDGFGDTQHQAVLDARRAVSEQISSKVTSVMESRESEASGERAKRSVAARIRAESGFDRAELIKITGFARRRTGWVARAQLDRAEAASVYAREIAADVEKMMALEPIVTQAIAEHDASVLLSTEQSPAHLIREQRRKTRIMSVLGHAPRPGHGDVPPPVVAVEKRAAKARRSARLRLKVSGKAAPELRRAVIDEVVKLLESRGCRVSEAEHGPAPEDHAAANLTLRIATRGHEEQGLRWRYVGIELVAVDARHQKPIFRYSGLPELAHGGGKTWAQADQAAARRLAERLPVKAAKRFRQISCR